MAKSTESYLDRAEAKIRGGQLQSARTILRDEAPRSPQRGSLARVANLARRAGWPEHSVKVLTRYVRSTDRKHINSATDAEKAEYGAALSALGANLEAVEVLGEVDHARYPQGLMLLAFAHIANWDYGAAIPLLQSFIARASEYEARVAKVNLLAAYVHEDERSRAQSLSEELLNEVRKEGNALLESNILQLSAHHAIRVERFDEARRALDTAAALTGGGASVYSLMIEKWRAVVNLKTASKAKSADALSALRQLGAEARRQASWETARDCEFHEALFTRSRDLLTKLYFGSPYEKYRERLVSEARPFFDAREHFPPSEYRHQIGAPKSREPAVLWLRNGETSLGRAALKPGQVLHRLLGALLSDFYRPQRLVSLYAQSFPDFYYNPLSSPKVTREAIRRLRAWIGESGLSLELVFEKGFYSLRSPRGLIVALERAGEGGGASDQRVSSREPKIRAILRAIKRKFGDKPFQTLQASEALGVPLRSMRRHLSEARKSGYLSEEGPAYQSSYRLRWDDEV